MNAAAGKGTQHQPFPWDTVLHVGLHLLRLPPSMFWALTPIEFFAIAGGLRPDVPPISRAGLEALMARFPDAIAPRSSIL